jgi:hypothetical protein
MAVWIKDNLFSESLLRAACAQMPPSNWPHWYQYGSGKLASKDPLRHPPAIAELISQILSLPVSKMTSIPNLMGDWDCHGGGMHYMPPGTSLARHLDSDHHPVYKWKRALNAVLYVTPDWTEDDGGEFCIESPPDETLPLFGRLLLFEPNDTAYHWVKPIRGDKPRRSLACFFYQDNLSGGNRPKADFMGAIG